MSATVKLLAAVNPYRKWDVLSFGSMNMVGGEAIENKGIVIRVDYSQVEFTTYFVKPFPKFRNKLHRYLWTKILRFRVWIGDKFPKLIVA